MSGMTLSAESLNVRYGGVRALSDVDILVEPGVLVGLIGPNGAGKTTLIDAVTGFTRYTGSVRLGATALEGRPPQARARAGLRRTFQQAELFDELTVREILNVAAAPPTMGAALAGVFRGQALASEAIDRALDLTGITDLGDLTADELTQGQRKLVDVARALAGRPDVVLLDEPAAGLNSTESQALGTRLRRIVNDGTGVLLIDHDMGLVLNVCDQVVVLDFGKVIARGTPAEIRANAAVVGAYLGKAAAAHMATSDGSQQ